MRFPWRCVLVVAALMVGSLLVAACGGDEEVDTERLYEAAEEAGREAIRVPIETVEDFGQEYFGALLDRDFEKVHSLLSQRCRDRVPIDQMEAAPESIPFFAELQNGVENGEVRTEVRELAGVWYQENQVSVQGEVAILLGASETPLLRIDERITLVREGGEWRLDSC